jgi:hypothetical protein
MYVSRRRDGRSVVLSRHALTPTFATARARAVREKGWPADERDREACSASERIEPEGTSTARPAGAAARPRRTAVAVLSFGLTGESTLCATRPRSP